MKEDIINLLQEKFEGQYKEEPNATPYCIAIASDILVKVTTELYTNPATYFDMLTCVTGIDNGPQVNTMEVIYNLYSIPFNHSLMIKVVLPRENPVIESVTSTWKSANWMEREIFDMYGIHFNNHPDLRRILMPADWQGHPLRKDYQQQESYRDITVAWQKPEA